MKEPVKPEKKFYQEHNANFYFDHVSSKVSIEYFLAWVKETTPPGAIDITLTLDENYDDYDGNLMDVDLQLGWKTIIDNLFYDKEMQKYEKKLAKWKKWQKDNQ